jgi:hypothetical protein
MQTIALSGGEIMTGEKAGEVQRRDERTPRDVAVISW